MSKKTYTVWIEIEEFTLYKDGHEKFENMDMPFAGTATFDSQADALDFARNMHLTHKTWVAADGMDRSHREA